MMYKEKSGAGQKVKALALVPMLALALGVASVPAVRAAVSTISAGEISISKGSENPSQGKTTVRTFTVTSINSDGNRTTVVVKGKGLGDNLTVSGGTFTTKGRTYHAKSLQCDMTDGAATITAVFPFSGDCKKTSMSLTVNGEEIPFNLEGFFDKANSGQAAPDNASSTMATVVINGNSTSSTGDAKFYLDGKVISENDLKSLPSDKIASITVDCSGSTTAVKIQSKQ